MRHYLLASAALLGLTAGMAQAATLSTESYTDKGPAGSTPNFASVGPSVQTSPDPGKMTVRMGGWVMTAIGAMGGNVANGTSTFTGTAGGVATTSTAPAGTQKVKTNPYGFDSFAYLYFGVDGRTINNLLYGALVEVRNNNQLGVGALTPGSTTVTQGTQTVASSSTNSDTKSHASSSTSTKAHASSTTSSGTKAHAS